MAPVWFRRCLSCGRLAHRSEFWRVVRLPTGEVVLDAGMGRSAYLCPTHTCLQGAKHKNRLGRVLRVAIPPEIYGLLAQRLSATPAATSACNPNREETT